MSGKGVTIPDFILTMGRLKIFKRENIKVL
jgi:hypothetical protein